VSALFLLKAILLRSGTDEEVRKVVIKGCFVQPKPELFQPGLKTESGNNRREMDLSPRKNKEASA
jgi:hypothetical protein